jgi:hypothetical protein
MEGNQKAPDTPENPSVYEALSYTWDADASNARQNIPILLNGSPFQVTANLESALRHLRLPTSQRTLWIDAICINQLDTAEKEHQINVMSEIYDRAQQVIVWLGPAGNNSDLGMMFAKEIYNWVDTNGRWIKDELYFKPLLEFDGTLSQIFQNLLGRELAASWTALFHVFCQRWWRRAWILQDLLVAKSVTVFCGKMNLPWSVMVVAITVCWNVDYYSNVQTELEAVDGQSVSRHLSRCYGLAVSRISRLENDPRKSIQRVPVNLDVWLVENRDRSCSLPHDKIFSILGLLNPAIRDLIQIDYNMTVTNLYKTTVKVYVEGSGCLSIICNSQHQVWQKNEPSWMPDWGLGLRAVPFTTQKQCMLNNSPLFNRAVTTFSIDLKSFTARGIRIGKISQTGLEFSILSDLFKGWRDPDACIEIEETADVRIDHRKLCTYGEGGWWFFPDSAAKLFQPAFETLPLNHIELGRHRVLHLFLDMVQLQLFPAKSDWYERHQLQSETPLANAHDTDHFYTLFHHLQALLRNRTLVILKDMTLGIGPEFAEPEDWVCILLGCPVSVVLRELEDGNFIFLGDGFIHGLKDDDILRGVENGTYQLQDFVLT